MNYDKWNKLDYDSNDDDENEGTKEPSIISSSKSAAVKDQQDFLGKINRNKKKGPVNVDEVLEFARNSGTIQSG